MKKYWLEGFITIACVFRALSTRFYDVLDPLTIKVNGEVIPPESIKYEGGNLPYLGINILEYLCIYYMYASTQSKGFKLFFSVCLPLILWDTFRQYTTDPYKMSKVEDYCTILTVGVFLYQLINIYRRK